jgi:hypothetical protein
MHDAEVRDLPRCGITPGPIPRDQWPRSLLEVATEHWLLELQDSGQHGTHSLKLIDAPTELYQPPVAELSFDHDDDAATMHVGRVHVAAQWRAHGLARGLYDVLQQLRPTAAVVHTELSPAGQRLVATLPAGWNVVRSPMLEQLPVECTGSMIDPGPGQEVRMVHATDWCPVHECDCGTAETQDVLDDQEELRDLHLDGEPFDPWWPHERWCGVRWLLPRQGLNVLCDCWHECPGVSCDDNSHSDGVTGPLPSSSDMDAALDQSLACAANLIRELTSAAQQQVLSEWVRGRRRQRPRAPEPVTTQVVEPEETWERFVASALPVEVGALPGCVTHPSVWGQHIDQLCAIEEPEHGYVPGRCSARAVHSDG